MTQLHHHPHPHPHSISNSNSNSIQPSSNSPNPPADLTLIHQSLIRLIQSNPIHPSPQSISIPTPLSLIALTIHSILISHSFILDSNPSNSPDHHHPLSTDWNAILSNDHHQPSLHFNYSHHHLSNLSFELTLSKIAHRISIAAIVVQDDRLANLDLSISEYVDPNDFPLDLTNELQSSSIGFRSSTHLLDFSSLFVNQILHHLLPDLIPIPSPNQRHPHSSSSTSNNHTSTSTTPTTSQSPPPPPPPPLPSIPQPNNPNSTHHRFYHHPSSQSPLEIGRSDLDPIGTSNLHIPSLYNTPAGRGLSTPSGMLVGPNHPIFDQHHRSTQPAGIFGGENRLLPPGAVPPGARFDPIGPGLARPNPHHQPFGFDLDPMGGLAQGLPLHNPHIPSRPPRPEFNDFRPPGGGGGGGGGGYDHMFM